MGTGMSSLITCMVCSIYETCYLAVVVFSKGSLILYMLSNIDSNYRSIGRVETLNVSLEYRLTVLFIDSIRIDFNLPLAYFPIINTIPSNVFTTN